MNNITITIFSKHQIIDTKKYIYDISYYHLGLVLNGLFLGAFTEDAVGHSQLVEHCLNNTIDQYY